MWVPFTREESLPAQRQAVCGKKDGGSKDILVLFCGSHLLLGYMEMGGGGGMEAETV